MTSRIGPGRRALSTFLALALVASGLVSGVAAVLIGTVTPAAAATGPCNFSVTGGGSIVTTPAGDIVVGAVAGSSAVTFDCNTSSGAANIAEASLLDGVSTSTVSAISLADVGHLAAIAASTTDTGCPAGTAGSCSVGTITLPAPFAASDPNAVCPPNQAQINAGLFGCALAAVTSTDTPVSGAETIVAYASQTTPPQAPTIQPAQTTGVSGDKITISDATGATGTWWADAVAQIQAVLTGSAAPAVPSTCGAGGGYGDVPSSPTAIGGANGFLKVNWFASGSTTAIAGDATGVKISNDCYDGTTLYGPTLGGTIPVPAGLTLGGTYTVYLCELDGTPYGSNDANVTTDCGTPPVPGTTYIDASFTFTVEGAAAATATPSSGGIGTQVQVVATGLDPQGTAVEAYFTTGSNTTVTLGTVSVTGSAGTCGAVTAAGSVTCTVSVDATDTIGSNPIEIYQSAGGPTTNLAAQFTVTNISTQCTVTSTSCSVQQVLTFSVLPGTLSLSEATSAVSMSPITLDGVVQQSTGNLQQVAVNDSRGTLVGWTLTGQFLGEFVNATPTGNAVNNTICVELTCPTGVVGTAGGGFNWTPTILSTPTQATAGPATTGGMSTSTPATLCYAVAGGGGGITDCGAALSLGVPPSVTRGSYTAVLQLTVS